MGSFIAFLLGVGLLLAGAWAARWPERVVSLDINQTRLDRALPLLQERVEIRQSFVPRHDGLTEVEVLPVRFEEQEGEGALTLRLVDEQATLLAEQRVETAALRHNAPFVLRFPQQPASAGRRYTLTARGSGQGPFSLWGYTLDMLPSAEFSVSGAKTDAQELYFITRYELTPQAALERLVEMVGESVGLLLLALAFMLMPGCLALLAGQRWAGQWDGVAWWGTALALGLALWPLLWFALSLAGGRWTGTMLWALLLLGWAAVVGLWIRQRRAGTTRGGAGAGATSRGGAGAGASPAPTAHAVMAMLLVGAGAVRLLAVRDLAFPPWVDAVRHALITEVMATSGQVITAYDPFLPIDHFPYHFGFHTVPASLRLMVDWPLPELLLYLGQLLNALTPLTVYAATWLITRRRGAALVAAFLVAFPFFFPAYYATWGRFTQLMGMLIIPVLVALTWLVARGGRRWQRAWWLVGVLAAGLFLIHLRVFLYYLPFPLLVWLTSWNRQRRWLLAAGVLAALLVVVRAVQLLPSSAPSGLLTAETGSYNAFPMGYLTAGWERAWVGLAAASLLVVLIAWLLKRPWASFPLMLALWVGMLFLLLAGRVLGLPESWLVNLNSMYITLFVPLALLLAIVGERLWRWTRVVRWLWQPLLGAAVTLLLLFGMRQQLTILNPQTILAEPPDRAGLAWVEANLPREARIAVSSWEWLGTTWAGSDGGAWLVPLTGRASSTPPADYLYDLDLARQVNAFNKAASEVSSWAEPSAAAWLRAEGITHLYVGARGGFLDPAQLARNPTLTLLYQGEGVFVFEVEGE